jgi:dihydrofolate synthase/folylpolyglutamate synthase
MLTAVAFLHFKKQQVDFAVIETGLGGRLDSTNVIKPIVSVITDISYDHTSVLGSTLELIAKEKSGIIKPGVPVVTSNAKVSFRCDKKSCSCLKFEVVCF